ncbi:MAG: hypothetical protein V4555_14925 [Acidobacteriota bacterium]
MSGQSIEMHDFVTIEGEVGTWETVGWRDSEPLWEVQLGRDAATKRFVVSEKLTLVQKAAKPELEPGFYLPNSIMGG